MNVVVWVLQVLLAGAFLFAGITKTTQPKEKLKANMSWTEDFSLGAIKLIGALEILAAIGLVLPAWTGIAPWLTPLAAVGLVLLMIAAAVTHLRLGEAQVIVVNAVLLILAAVVAWARFGPYSY
jgi:uncharacterized membrane protein